MHQSREFTSVAVLIILASGAALGGVFTSEDFKLVAPDAELGDGFGSAVAVGDGIVAVGASGDDDAGSASGSVYLYDAGTGAFLHKLAAEDARALWTVGSSVATADGLVVAGGWLASPHGDFSGSAYIFDAATGSQVWSLTPSNPAPFDQFGTSVAIEDGVVLASSRTGDGDVVDQGIVYIFDAATGQETGTLEARDGLANDNFGISCDLDGGIAVVGASGRDEVAKAAGAVYLFDVASGEQIDKIAPDFLEEANIFGFDVAMSNGIIVVGAPGNDDPLSNPGKAYIFDASTRELMHTLTSPDGDLVGFYGFRVDTDGTVAVVGEFVHDAQGVDESGAVFVYDVATGALLQTLVASDAEETDHLGNAVAIDGGTVVTGAPDDSTGGVISGSAYVYKGIGGTRPRCAEDLDGSGTIDSADLNFVLGDFGIGDGGDIDGDGDTDSVDLNLLLAVFGDACG